MSPAEPPARDRPRPRPSPSAHDQPAQPRRNTRSQDEPAPRPVAPVNENIRTLAGSAFPAARAEHMPRTMPDAVSRHDRASAALASTGVPGSYPTACRRLAAELWRATKPDHRDDEQPYERPDEQPYAERDEHRPNRTSDVDAMHALSDGMCRVGTALGGIDPLRLGRMVQSPDQPHEPAARRA